MAKLAVPVWRLPVACSLVLALLLAGACGGRLQPATAGLVDDAEARWQARGPADYQVLVDVERGDDSFQAEVRVEAGRIVDGFLRYRENGRWGEPIALSENQAFPYTVPGLFNIVRLELAAAQRQSIQLELDEEYAYPRRIVLGPVLQDGAAVAGTATTLVVRRFTASAGTNR